MAENTLYYGDNLDVLRQHIKDESVDLVYLDPPFNSNATYNVLFSDKGGAQSSAQLQAFKDTWSWKEAVPIYQELILLQGSVGKAIRAFGDLLPHGGLLAYLVMMAPRLDELRRVLKPTGSIYLHCDPTASHYLKVLMDAIFGLGSFRNEIVWERTNAHNMRVKGYVRANDTILFYTKTGDFEFNDQYLPYGERQLARYKADENGRLYTGQDLTFSTVNPNRQFEWRGTRPAPNRSWGASLNQLEKWYADGRILLKKDGTPRLDGFKFYLDESKGVPLTTNWTDIPRIRNTASERLGYATQKPQELLERIIRASSNPGDVVLDPFCGCGTAVAAAQFLGRRWIGIDITQAAIVTIRQRLANMAKEGTDYRVVGEPTTVPDALRLANENPYQFQWWSLGLVGARPTEQKKGSDRGIDGRLYFDDTNSGQTKQIILSVKAGHTGVAHIHELRGVIEREKALIGVLIAMQEPTNPMLVDAAEAGYYESPWGKYPRIQILTIAELLAGKKIDYPPAQGVNVTFEKAPKAKTTKEKQPKLELE